MSKQLELITESFTTRKAYLVIWGSKTHTSHVIERCVDGEVDESSIPPVKAAYYGDVMRIRSHVFGTRHEVMIPCYGVFATADAARAYAQRLHEVVDTKSRGRKEYGTLFGNVEKLRHYGKHLYCGLRKGLWTFHFPTWKEHVQMCKEYDELDAQGVFDPSPYLDGERMCI